MCRNYSEINLHHHITILHIFNFHFQQLLFHLSQISPRRNNINLKKDKQAKKLLKSNFEQVTLSKINIDEILCSDSFDESLKNLRASPNFENFSALPLNNVCKKIFSFLLKKEKLNNKTFPWHVSYIPVSKNEKVHTNINCTKNNGIFCIQNFAARLFCNSNIYGFVYFVKRK